MTTTARDQRPPHQTLMDEVIDGLLDSPRHLPCKLFYDAEGSQLFEDICRLPEYYPTRTELAIMRDHGQQIAAACGRHCRVVEFGCGSGEKTQLLMAALEDPTDLVLIDISPTAVEGAAAAISKLVPGLTVVPVTGDYTAEIDLPKPAQRAERTVVYFPGSTLGNFTWTEAISFLKHCRDLIGANGGIILGTDLDKDPAVIEAAYNDSAGVTAAFNRNLLAHCNRALGSNFDTSDFSHRAPYDCDQRRIEMQLIANRDQTVSINGRDITITAGSVIRTEYSHKYRLEDLHRLAVEVGLCVRQTWTDANQWFGVSWLTLADD